MVTKILLITQARMSSTRLPAKVMKEVQGEPLLLLHLRRLESSKMVDNILVATTTSEKDDLLCAAIQEWGFDFYRGSEDDVLDRYYQAAKLKGAEWVVRVTSDCPLLDPVLVDEVIEHTIKCDVDYGSNVLKETFPDGQDVEVFKFKALEKAWKESVKRSEREHVTSYIIDHSDFNGFGVFTAANYSGTNENFSDLRMTVDEVEDLELIRILVKALGPDKTWREYVHYLIETKLVSLNSKYTRNEGYIKSLKDDHNG